MFFPPLHYFSGRISSTDDKEITKGSTLSWSSIVCLAGKWQIFSHYSQNVIMQLWEDGRTYPVWLRRPKREEYFQLSDLCGWSCSREGISRPPGSAGTPLGSEAPSGASPVLRVNADNSLKKNKIKNPMLFLWWYCQTNKRQVGCVYVKYNGQTVFPSSLLQKKLHTDNSQHEG